MKKKELKGYNPQKDLRSAGVSARREREEDLKAFGPSVAAFVKAGCPWTQPAAEEHPEPSTTQDWEEP